MRRSAWIFQVAPKSVISVPIKRRAGETCRTEEEEETRGRERSGAAASQGTLGATRRWKRQGAEASCHPPRERGPANAVIPDVRPPERREDAFLLFQATQFVVICYGSHKNRIQVIDTYGSNVKTT